MNTEVKDYFVILAKIKPNKKYPYPYKGFLISAPNLANLKFQIDMLINRLPDPYILKEVRLNDIKGKPITL